MQHVVINVFIVIMAMLTMCYPIMAHATLILYYPDLASMVALQTSLISRALWLPHA